MADPLLRVLEGQPLQRAALQEHAAGGTRHWAVRRAGYCACESAASNQEENLEKSKVLNPTAGGDRNRGGSCGMGAMNYPCRLWEGAAAARAAIVYLCTVLSTGIIALAGGANGDRAAAQLVEIFRRYKRSWNPLNGAVTCKRAQNQRQRNGLTRTAPSAVPTACLSLTQSSS